MSLRRLGIRLYARKINNWKISPTSSNTQVSHPMAKAITPESKVHRILSGWNKIRLLHPTAAGLVAALPTLPAMWVLWLAWFCHRSLSQPDRQISGIDESGAFHGGYAYTILAMGALTLLMVETLRQCPFAPQKRMLLLTGGIVGFLILPCLVVFLVWLGWYHFPSGWQEQLCRVVVILTTPVLAALAWASVMRDRPLGALAQHVGLCLCTWLIAGRLTWAALDLSGTKAASLKMLDKDGEEVLRTVSDYGWRGWGHAFDYFWNAPFGVVVVAAGSFLLTWGCACLIRDPRRRQLTSLLIATMASSVAVLAGYFLKPVAGSTVPGTLGMPPATPNEWRAENDPKTPPDAEPRQAWSRRTGMTFNGVFLKGLPDDVREITEAQITRATSADGKSLPLTYASFPNSWVTFIPDRQIITGGKPSWRVEMRLPVIPELAAPGVIKVEGKLAFICGRRLFECDASSPEITTVPGSRINWGSGSNGRYPPQAGPNTNSLFSWDMGVTKWSPGASLTGAWWAYPARPDERRRKGFRHPSWPVTFNLPGPVSWVFQYHSGDPSGHGKLFHKQMDRYTFYWQDMDEKSWNMLSPEEAKEASASSIAQWMTWWNEVRVTFYEPTLTTWADFCLHVNPPPQSDWSLRKK